MLLLHELFAQCANKFPDKRAIAWDTNSSITVITYSELMSEIDIVRNQLRAVNAQYEYVGIQLNSLLIYPALVLGILYSKCAYVVLDLKNDIEWNLNLVEKLNLRVVITDCDSKLTESWRLLGKLCIHNQLASVMCSNRPFNYSINKDNFIMAYAIQTSGTTGRPKVVQVPHRCIVPNIIQLRDIFEVEPCDTVFLSSPITFDPSVIETFTTLTSGACLLIAPDFIRSAPGPILLQFLFNRPRICGSVSILSVTPSYAACLFCSAHSTSSIIKKINPNLKILCLGGEPCPSITTLEMWKNKLGERTRVFTLYGITEVSCWASIAEVSFARKPYPEVPQKRKGTSKGDFIVQLESKPKNLKLNELTFMEQDSTSDVPIGDLHMEKSICKTNVLSHCYLDPDFVSKSASSKNESFGINKEVIETSSSDKNISEVSLGLPMSQTILEVRDSIGHAVCHGEGELFIGSDTRVCLLDNESADILEGGNVIFRATGDIVHVRNLNHPLNQSFSTMYYKGRRDGAVKRFGQWIFVESVESAASEFIWSSGITFISVASACCVWCHKETGRGKLGLFVVPSEKGMFQEPESQSLKKKFVEDLASHLTRVLPTNSWPDVILPIKEFPLSNHGKVDRENLLGRLKDLLAENIVKSGRVTSKAPNELLHNFKSLWMQYLKINHEPSPSDKFLMSGGDSLLALRLVAELEDSVNYAISPMLLINLINGTYEEACSSIHISDLSDIEHVPTSSSSTSIGKSDLAVNLKPSIRSEEVPISDHEATKCEGANRNTDADVCLCNEYTRGKIIRHHSSSKMFYTFLTVGKSPAMSEKWKYHLEKCVDASPVALQYMNSKSIAVVGSHSGLLAAVNLETGEQIFRCVLPDRIESSACSSPCGKFIFVGCYDHCLYCISVPEGKITWSFSAEEMVKSSPLIVNHGTSVVFGSYSGYLYCINIKHGDLLWKIKPHDGSIYSSPALYQESTVLDNFIGDDKVDKTTVNISDSTAISTGIILCATLSGACVALTEKEGRILWTSELKAPVFTSPLVYGHHAVFSSVKGRVICFSVKSGEMVWSYQAGGNVFSSFSTVPMEKSQLIVFGCHDHYVYCLNGDGVLQWKTLVDSPVFATPFIFPVKFYDGLKHEVCSEGDGFTTYLVAVGSTAGHLYIFDTCGGTIMVKVKVNGQIFSSPTAHQNHIIFGCRDNFLYCFTLV